MRLPTTTQVQDLIDRLMNSWSAGNGQEFGNSFTSNAHFVAFDGTVLRGTTEIANYHQKAFDRHLKNTELVTSVDETFPIGDSAILVVTSGGIRSKSGNITMLSGASVQLMAVETKNDVAVILAFQNTRRRPITGEESAQVWKDFDRSWNRLSCSE